MELRKHTMFTSHWIWELHTKEFFFKRAGVAETGPHLCLWAHLLLGPSLPWSTSPTCCQLSECTKLSSILRALPYFPGSPALHWKDGGCTSASLSESAEVTDCSVFLVLNEVPSGSLHFTFLCLNCSEHLHTWMLPLDFPGLSLRPFLQRGPNPQFHFYPQGLSYCLYSTYHYVKLCIHWFVYLFTVYPVPHHESRNSAFVVHQYLFSAF